MISDGNYPQWMTDAVEKIEVEDYVKEWFQRTVLYNWTQTIRSYYGLAGNFIDATHWEQEDTIKGIELYQKEPPTLEKFPLQDWHWKSVKKPTPYELYLEENNAEYHLRADYLQQLKNYRQRFSDEQDKINLDKIGQEMELVLFNFDAKGPWVALKKQVTDYPTDRRD